LGTLVLAFVIVVAAMFAADSRSATPPPATQLPTVPQSETGHEASEIPYPEVPRISPAEVRARYEAGTALFVDVRSEGEYETAHIPNAIPLSLADLETRYRELPRDAEIITYCT
jgi:3-mercaptopyruvate sulfurtransferase SseA